MPETPAWKPATTAVHAGRPPHEPDQPLNVAITPASTHAAGGAKEHGRYTNDSRVAFRRRSVRWRAGALSPSHPARRPPLTAESAQLHTP